ncbi:MAG: hypothetical protein BJ554DRAFT_137, partial [Olpidium bornovanus]
CRKKGFQDLGALYKPRSAAYAALCGAPACTQCGMARTRCGMVRAVRYGVHSVRHGARGAACWNAISGIAAPELALGSGIFRAAQRVGNSPILRPWRHHAEGSRARFYWATPSVPGGRTRWGWRRCPVCLAAAPGVPGVPGVPGGRPAAAPGGGTAVTQILKVRRAPRDAIATIESPRRPLGDTKYTKQGEKIRDAKRPFESMRQNKVPKKRLHTENSGSSGARAAFSHVLTLSDCSERGELLQGAVSTVRALSRRCRGRGFYKTAEKRNDKRMVCALTRTMKRHQFQICCEFRKWSNLPRAAPYTEEVAEMHVLDPGNVEKMWKRPKQHTTPISEKVGADAEERRPGVLEYGEGHVGTRVIVAMESPKESAIERVRPRNPQSERSNGGSGQDQLVPQHEVTGGREVDNRETECKR